MAISRKTFERLLTIAETFPGYFAGSNARSTIVGGNILTHDHYRACLPYGLAGLLGNRLPGLRRGSSGYRSLSNPHVSLRLQSDSKGRAD